MDTNIKLTLTQRHIDGLCKLGIVTNQPIKDADKIPYAIKMITEFVESNALKVEEVVAVEQAKINASQETKVVAVKV